MEISFSKYTALYRKLNKDISNLKNIGRFLSLWDCTIGLPKTNPTELPYIYKTGDYYRIQNTSEEGTKYVPNGSQYTGEASTTVDTEDSKTGDIWFYDGAIWSRQTGGGTTDHSQLSNLDYEHAGHIGFQPTINDLDTIRFNASVGKTASDTISGYGNIVTHNASEFATAAQGALAETAEQTANKVTALSAQSTDAQYPSAKCVYDIIGNVEQLILAL